MSGTGKSHKSALGTTVLVFMLVYLGLGILYLNNLYTNHLSGEEAALSAVGLWICFSAILPSFMHMNAMRQGRLQEPIPVVPAIGLVYAVYYGLPFLFGNTPAKLMMATFDHESLSRSAWFALGGWWCFVGGYYVLGQLTRTVRPIKLQIYYGNKTERNAFYLTAFGFFMMTLVSPILRKYEALRKLLEILESTFDMGMGYLILISLRTKLKGFRNVVLWWFWVPFYFIMTLSSGFLATFLMAAIYVIMLIMACNKKIPTMLIMSVLVLGFIIRLSIADFRKQAWTQKNQSMSIFQRTEKFIDISTNRFKKAKSHDTSKHGLEDFRARTSMISIFAHTVRLTPKIVPYWGGATYYHFLISFIPRAIWRDKPVHDVGQRFGHRYNLLDIYDTSTSANLPLIVEMYINYGPAAVYFGMLFLGFSYRFLSRKSNSFNSGDGTVLIACLLLRRLMLIECNFAVLHGDLLKHGVIIGVIFRFLGAYGTKVSNRRLVNEKTT